MTTSDARTLNARFGAMSRQNLAAALNLANQGFRVFPAQPVKKTGGWSKPPYISQWKSSASSDPSQIMQWWRHFPDAIPALCCDDIIVIDADRHLNGPDGVAALESMIASQHPWPPHPIVLTPSNGQHHYFQQTSPKLGNGTGQLPTGIDVRGTGGFVIGLGAVLPDGTGWRPTPTVELDGSIHELPVLPDWLLDLICKRTEQTPSMRSPRRLQKPNSFRHAQYANAALKAAVEDVRTAPDGRRNTVLNNVAYRLGRMVGAGWIDRSAVETSLRTAAHRLERDDGLAAVKATLRSGLDAGARKPHAALADRKGRT
jgi:bifunctional DNA primase/polymerase-like protein